MNNLRKKAMSILLCSSLLAGCTKEADITESSTESAPTTIATEETTSEETTTSTSAVLSDDIEMQLQIIYDNYDIWKLHPIDEEYFSEEDELNSASYAVTDLDNDGMPEIIKTGWAGTSHNTLIAIYEVTEDGELVLISEEWESPDLWNTDSIRYYADADGIRWYLVTDQITNDSTGQSRYVIHSRFSIDDGIVTEPYCTESYNPELNEDTDTYETICRYYDADDNEITEDEFEQLASEYDSLVEGESEFGWISAIDGQPSLEQLEASYRTFIGS